MEHRERLEKRFDKLFLTKNSEILPSNLILSTAIIIHPRSFFSYRGCREQPVRKVLLVHKDRKECREAGATEDPMGSLETMLVIVLSYLT